MPVFHPVIHPTAIITLRATIVYQH